MSAWKRNKSSIIKAGTIAGSIMVLCGFAAGTWSVANDLGVRPVLVREISIIEFTIAAQGTRLLWIEFANYEAAAKRKKLSATECAKYRGIAVTLGLEPPSCG